MRNLILAFCLMTSALKGEQLETVIQRTKDGDIKITKNVGHTTVNEFKNVKRIGEVIDIMPVVGYKSKIVSHKEDNIISHTYVRSNEKLYCFVETYEITGSILYESTDDKITNYIILGAE